MGSVVLVFNEREDVTTDRSLVAPLLSLPPSFIKKHTNVWASVSSLFLLAHTFVLFFNGRVEGKGGAHERP